MKLKTALKTIGGGLQLLWINLVNPYGKYNRFPSRNTKRVIVLVPGWLGPASSMDALARRFEEEGFTVCTFHMGFWSLLPLKFLRRMLQRFLFALSVHCPDLNRIYLVAHSMGGLVCWDLIQTGNVDGKRVRMVALGAMFQGTIAAIFGLIFSFSAWQLLPFRSRFNPRPHHGRMHYVPLLSIAGRSDVVVPPDRSHHPQAINEDVPADHGSLLTGPHAFRLALNFFRKADDEYDPPVRESTWGPYR